MKVLKTPVFFPNLESTNKYLKNGDFPHGTVVRAGEQTRGYGRHGANWASGQGGLWFSFIIKRKIKKPYLYVILSAVAILNALEKYKIKAKIKWPNDIFVDGKKAAGILIENDAYKGRLVVGIGINVNNKIGGELRDTATSLRLTLKKSLPESEIFNKVLFYLDRYLSDIGRQRKKLIKKWTDAQTDIFGKTVTAKGLKGKVVSVNADGTVNIKTDNNQIKKIAGDRIFA